MRAALLSARSVRSVLPVLSRSSPRALAPSRLVSTEAAAEGSTASKPGSRGERLVKEMTPVATFLGIVVTIGAIGAYYSSRLAALEERMMGTAGKLEERVAGSEKTLQERVAGIMKEVDAKNTGSEKAVDAKIIGFEKAADLKVRLRSARATTHTIVSLTLARLPLPPCSTWPSDELVSVVAVSVVFGRCISGIGRCAETKVKHWFKFTCTGGVGGSSRAWVLDVSEPSSGSSTVPGSPVRGIFQGSRRTCFPFLKKANLS